MPISEAYSRSAATVGTTEYSIVNDSTTLATDTTDGVYQLYVDPTTMAKGDEYVFRIYEKVISTDAKQLVQAWTLFGVQNTLLVTPTLILMHGWDMTAQKVAGTDRAFDFSIRKVA